MLYQPSLENFPDEELAQTAADWGIAKKSLSPMLHGMSAKRFISVGDGKRVILDARLERELLSRYAKVSELGLALGLSLPRVYDIDHKRGFGLVEFFGTKRLSDMIDSRPNEASLLTSSIEALVQKSIFQKSRPFDLPIMTQARAIEEAKDFFRFAAPGTLQPYLLEELGERLADAILNEAAFEFDRRELVLGDFEPENLHVLQWRLGARSCGILDFDDAFYGNAIYDLAALIESARRINNHDFVEEAFDHYANNLGFRSTSSRLTARRSMKMWSIQRQFRIIGLFFRKQSREGEEGYLRFVSGLCAGLKQNVMHERAFSEILLSSGLLDLVRDKAQVILMRAP